MCKATISFNMYVHRCICPSTWTDSAPAWRSSWNLIFEDFFLKTVEKIQFLLKYHKDNRNFTRRKIYFFIICHSILLRMENFSDKISEKIGRHFLFIVALPPPHPFYVIMRKNGAEWGRPQMTLWCMHKACWINEAKETCSLYVMHILFHCNNGCTKATQHYVICTLPVKF